MDQPVPEQRRLRLINHHIKEQSSVNALLLFASSSKCRLNVFLMSSFCLPFVGMVL